MVVGLDGVALLIAKGSVAISSMAIGLTRVAQNARASATLDRAYGVVTPLEGSPSNSSSSKKESPSP